MLRRWVQAISALVINPHWPSVFARTIYSGNLKGFCVPGLNCYSCPLAIFACPVGTIQNFLARIRPSIEVGEYYLGLYVIGTLGMVGSAVGRMACGWVCPFGALQDVLHKIPAPEVKIPRFLNYFKYVVLVVMVIVLPFAIVDASGYGYTWFCKYICPAGTLEAGIPMVLLQPYLQSQIGFLFWIKVAILVSFIGLMIFSKRPFCRTTCPLGAIYSLFNRISILKMLVSSKCITCDKCYKVCPMDIKIYENPDDRDCIRCLDCVKVCPVNAITYKIAGQHLPKEQGESTI